MNSRTESSRHLIVYQDGEIIFSQGDEGREMYIVEDGKVEIVLQESDGDLVQLGVLERGDFFGEMAVLENAPRTATARARGRTKLLPLRGTVFTEVLQRNPETTLRIMRKLCGRIRELQQRLNEQPDAEARVVAEMAPPPLPPTPAENPLLVRLVHDSGAILVLPDVAEALVGRPDPAVGRVPEVDLTALNEERSVSRCHARIINRQGRLFVVEDAGALNGTFVNDERVEGGASVEVGDGDVLCFGTVKLTLDVEEQA